jgi:hypothetical protein
MLVVAKEDLEEPRAGSSLAHSSRSLIFFCVVKNDFSFPSSFFEFHRAR